MQPAVEVARVPIATPEGEFDVRAFECESGFIYLAMVKGDIGDGAAVLTRLHSECLTGDALGSLRCDCGIQLRTGLRSIAAEGRGVLVYLTGHEGRGIGLVNKLRAYMLQDAGADTVEANHQLGLPTDARDYSDAASVLAALGVRSVRLLTNNPDKLDGLRRAGMSVEELVPLPTSMHVRNLNYLRTKRQRMGHVAPAGDSLPDNVEPPADVTQILGSVRSHPWRPHVVLKYAQTLDGRIATTNGDSKWISGEPERRISHALRAACDAVLVGAGTVLIDDPQLTVRMVPGPSPIRVVLDSTLRIPLEARVLDDAALTILVTTDRSTPERRLAFRSLGASVLVVDGGPDGVDLLAALRSLRGAGIRSLLVEGGARVLTSMLAAGVVDRVIVSVAPTIIGAGTDAVGELSVASVADGFRLSNRSVKAVGDDVLIAGDVGAAAEATGAEAAGE